MADSTTRRFKGYHQAHFHRHLHIPAPDFVVDTIYAAQLGPVTAAEAAHGTTDKWEGVKVIPLDQNDEIHFAWSVPFNLDHKNPVYVRLLYIPNHNSAATALTVTYDKLSMGATQTGSGTAGNGGSTMAETIEAVTDGMTDADIPFASPWAKIAGGTSEFDVLFINIVAGAVSGADRLHVWGLQFLYHPLTA